MSSRRGFLKTTLGACWTGAALLEQAVFRAEHARALANGSEPKLFDIEKVAEGVYAAIARPQALLNCNAAIFENSADLLVVDTHSKPSAVTALVTQIRREVTNKPVRYIVNSHFHWDHTQGTGAYRRAFPHADVISSETTRRLISENGAARLKASLDEVRKSIEEYKQKLAGAQSAEQKRVYSDYLRQSEAFLAEMRDYQPELPNVTISEDLILRDRAHDLHLAFRGQAHTAGDVFVWCPQKKVLASGDALHGFLPFIGDGYPRKWPVTLLKVAEFEFDRVIGGHGGVQHTRERLYQMGTYIDELTAAVDAARGKGKTIEQMRAEITPATLTSLRGDYRQYLLEGMKYNPVDPGTKPEGWLAESVRTNVADVYATIDKI